MENASSTINGYNGCSTTTCRTPDDVFISWIDGAMTTTGEIRKEAHIPNKSLADPKTKSKWRRQQRRTEQLGRRERAAQVPA